MMSSNYELRTGIEGTRHRKQSMAELKLRRLQELVLRLKEDLDRRRIPVSEASIDLIKYTQKEPKDWMVPSVWGHLDKRENPYENQQKAGLGCCTVM